MVGCGARAGLSVVVKRRPGGKRRPDVGLTEVGAVMVRPMVWGLTCVVSVLPEVC